MMECQYCGRRHGESPLVAPLDPLQFGAQYLRWAWLDERPPAALVQRSGRLQRTAEGYLWRDWNGTPIPPANPEFPRQREQVVLWLYVPTRRWDGWEEFYCCDLCAPHAEEIPDYRRERVPLVETVGAGQLVLLGEEGNR